VLLELVFEKHPFVHSDLSHGWGNPVEAHNEQSNDVELSALGER